MIYACKKFRRPFHSIGVYPGQLYSPEPLTDREVARRVIDAVVAAELRVVGTEDDLVLARLVASVSSRTVTFARTCSTPTR